MNILYVFLVLVVIVGVYFWVKSNEKDRYNKLSPTEKLWEDYEKFNPLCDEGQRIGNELECLLISEMTGAKTLFDLRSIKADFLGISFARAFFWGRTGSLLEKIFLTKNESFADKPGSGDSYSEQVELLCDLLDRDRNLDSLSFIKVMQATTHAELDAAIKLLRHGSRAEKAVPLVREEISMVEYDAARSDAKKLEEVFAQTPIKGEAEKVSFAALRQFYKKPTAVIKSE